MRDIPKQISDLNSKYGLFRKKLGTFVDSLLFFLKQEGPVLKPIRTVEQVDSLVIKYGYMNLTFNTTAKLWLQIYDDLRCLIRDEIDAAQDASKEISDETLKIRVTEALEYVNDLTQPTFDVVEGELEQKLQQPHDELFQLSFTERKVLGPIVSLMPVAIDAAQHAGNLVEKLKASMVRREMSRPTDNYEEWDNDNWHREIVKSPVKRSVISKSTWYGPTRVSTASTDARTGSTYRKLRPMSGKGYTRKL